MSLESKWWITENGDFQMTGKEHADFAIAAMLLMPKKHVRAARLERQRCACRRTRSSTRSRC